MTKGKALRCTYIEIWEYIWNRNCDTSSKKKEFELLVRMEAIKFTYVLASRLQLRLKMFLIFH